MNVEQLIEALQKVENKQLPVVFYDNGMREVSEVDSFSMRRWNGVSHEDVPVCHLWAKEF